MSELTEQRTSYNVTEFLFVCIHFTPDAMVEKAMTFKVSIRKPFFYM